MQLTISRPIITQVTVSLLIVFAGLLAAHALDQIDRDLRILYAEYTLAAADLGHVSGDLIRYRSTILRALEAPTKQEAERIAASLPAQRAKILRTIDRYAAASQQATRGGPTEAPALRTLRASVGAYFADADETMRLVQQRWATTRQDQAAEWQEKAEQHASAQAGVTLIQVSVALDQLLETVATVAGTMHAEGVQTIRRSSLLLVGGSLVLVALVLFGQRASLQARAAQRDAFPATKAGAPDPVAGPRPAHRLAGSPAPPTGEPRYQEVPPVTGDPGS